MHNISLVTSWAPLIDSELGHVTRVEDVVSKSKKDAISRASPPYSVQEHFES